MVCRRACGIETVPEGEAQGLLQKVYAKILGNAGDRVANILKCQSLHPETLKAHYDLYQRLMFGKSPLSRSEREMIAVVVSATNGCHY